MKYYFLHFIATLSMLLFVNFLQAQTPQGYTWQEVHNIDFGDGANHFTIEAASAGLGGEVELRLDAVDGLVIGRAYFHQTGDSAYFLPYECDLTLTVSGTHDVYMNFLDYAEPDGSEKLKVGHFEFSLVQDPLVTERDSLHIYPPVPGLDPSPYYNIYVQKVSDLNSSNLSEVTNWETPFAWFTQCPDYNPDVDTKGYYSRFIGGWSNTYTNFELDPNTPIVVKIVRKDDTGDDAPGGPIDTAVVRPAHRVDSWEIIDGDVYVTMSEPALVSVDFDGQLETRVAPRGTPTGWGDSAFPYNNKEKGAHAVTIFANPFINDKPNPDDPGVLVVKAGEKIPGTEELENMDWDILYFEPGIHKASVDVDSEGNLVERGWQETDIITFQDNKSYYIPGDAIVYANFTDKNRSNNQSVNIRIYGHGTVSGSKITRYTVEGEAYSNDGWWHRALEIRNAENCHFEGITAVDPAFHTLCIISNVKDTYEPNTVKWAKVLAWRTNSDGTALGGNVEMEDCFLRCQDDGHYIGGTTSMRRVVFWHDVNGKSLRGDFINRRYSGNNAPNIPKLIVIEDIDFIYERGVFGNPSSTGFAMIGVVGGTENATLAGGVENTGQMVVFRDIRVTDPHPGRPLFGFDSDDKIGDYAGLRFENIHAQSEQAFAWPNRLLGTSNSKVRNFVFDNVTIAGKKIDSDLVYNSDLFESVNTKDLTFRLRDTVSSDGFCLTRTSTNGTISLDTTAGRGAQVGVVAIPDAGYKFACWNGDLTGTNSDTVINMNSSKAITASFELITYSISAMAENGAFIFKPDADSYLPGTEVTVTAVGNLGYGFKAWGGDLSGTENSITIVMDGDKRISASFNEIETYSLDITSSYGVVNLDPPGGEYNPGTLVTLLPDANASYYFEQWFGDLEGSENPAKIRMDSDKTVEARFVFGGTGGSHVAINFGGPDYTAGDGTLYRSNTEGSTYSNNNSISGTEDDALYQSQRYGKNFSLSYPVENGIYEVVLMFSEVYFNDSGKRIFSVVLEEEEVISNLDVYAKVGGNTAYNESFRVNITDGEININLSASINNAKICALRIIGEEFQGQNYRLATNAPSNGVVEITPLKESYPEGSNVELNAIPGEGYKFEGWSGDLSGSENPATLYMNGDKNVSATFVQTNWYSLTTSATNGTISFDPEEGIYGYSEGTEVSLTVSPDEGFKFTGWSGDLSGTGNPATIVMETNKTVTANFVELTYYTLSTEAANGSITLDPQGGEYSEGTVVTLTANPDSSYLFDEWSGDIAGSENPVTITMDSDKNVTAEFENPNALLLTISSENGTVQVTPAQESYYRGASVILVATPDEGYKFAGWEGDVSGLNNPIGFVIDGNKNITAVFSEIPSTSDLFTEQKLQMVVYPNPFSTEMAIIYQLHEASDVKLAVYNFLGQKITTLVNEFQTAGEHSVKWRVSKDNSQLTNGLYFFRLETGNGHVQLNKSVLHR